MNDCKVTFFDNALQSSPVASVKKAETWSEEMEIKHMSVTCQCLPNYYFVTLLMHMKHYKITLVRLQMSGKIQNQHNFESFSVDEGFEFYSSVHNLKVKIKWDKDELQFCSNWKYFHNIQPNQQCFLVNKNHRCAVSSMFRTLDTIL